MFFVLKVVLTVLFVASGLAFFAFASLSSPEGYLSRLQTWWDSR